MKRNIALFFIVIASSFVAVQPVFAQEQQQVPTLVLISNVNIFDGSDKLVADMSVLVEGNKIAKIANSIEAPAGATVIDAKGRTMTPGLIDSHVHLAWVISSPYAMFDAPVDYQAALALVEAKAMLMRGYTSIRDTAGQVFGTKRAIDEGLFPGPRIWGCGAAISMTSGHGDFRTLNTEPRQMGGSNFTEVERIQLVIFADGVPEVLIHWISPSIHSTRSRRRRTKPSAGIPICRCTPTRTPPSSRRSRPAPCRSSTAIF